jgi:hypothetical protein
VVLDADSTIVVSPGPVDVDSSVVELLLVDALDVLGDVVLVDIPVVGSSVVLVDSDVAGESSPAGHATHNDASAEQPPTRIRIETSQASREGIARAWYRADWPRRNPGRA